MLYIIVAILIFGFLIATHELGHFASAKLLGVKVNEFAVGMGPALLQRQKGETLYSLRALPIGGYCAMEGEDDDSADPRSFGRAAGWKKFLILCAGAAMNFLTGLVVLLVLYTPAVGFYEEVYGGPLEGYGVAREDILDGSVYLSAGATAEEASVLVLKDADTAATVLEALQAHVDLQKESYESYLPAEIPKLDNARLVTHGNSVVLVVPADSDA